MPVFIDGTRGSLFALDYPPAVDSDRGHCFVCVPPLVEEANRCRRMLAMQARAYQRLGFRVLMVDPFGTGDSDGDFADADWDAWRADLGAVIASVPGETIVSLWAVRGGTLLAADYLQRTGDARIAHLVLWQPVLDGRLFLSQFLRLRTIAGVIGSDGERESVRDLRARLTGGETLEVAGYSLSPTMADALESCRLTDLATTRPVHWFELSPAGATDEAAELSPAGRRVVDAWRERGMSVTTALYHGEPFWTTTEITEAPALIDATCDAVANW